MSQPIISVVVPVYNEEAAIAEDLSTIKTVMAAYDQPFEIIVVDDGSTDRSAEIVTSLSDIRLLKHPYNRGTGAALKTGIRAAGGEIIVMTDGDGTYPNQDIPKLLQFLGEYDMVVGARTSEQGTLKLLRVPTKAFIRWLASYLTDTNIPDLNSGLRAFKKDLALPFFGILPNGHSFVSTITLAFLSNDHSVFYVPIDYFPRKGGQSKFHPLRDTYNYMLLVIRSVLYFNPIKIFLPVSIILGTIGLVKMIYDMIEYNFHIAPSTLLLIMATLNIAAVGMLADLIVKRLRLK